MGWLVETWLVHKGKEHFTGNMTEFTTEAGAKEEAEAEAKGIGDDLGLPVRHHETVIHRHHGPMSVEEIGFVSEVVIEIRCRENKR